MILVGLSNERNIKKGALAAAFGVSDEHRRRLCKIAEEQGMQALPGRRRGGSEPKIQGRERERVLKLFEEGHRPVYVYRKHGKRLGVTYATLQRMHQIWTAESEQTAMRLATGSNNRGESVVTDLPSSEPKGDDFERDEPVAAALCSGKNMQHLGGLLLVAMIASFGLYDAALKGWSETAQ